MTAIGTSRAHTSAQRAWQLAAGVYIAALVVWLGLGLLPELTAWVPWLGHAFRSLAAGRGTLASLAGKVIQAQTPSSMGSAMTTMTGERGQQGSDGVLALTVQYLFSLVNLALGALLVVRRFDAVVPRLMAFALLGTAATFNGPSHAVFHVIGSPAPVTLVHFAFHIISGVTYLWAVTLFPDGRPPFAIKPAWAGRLGFAVITAAITWVCWRSSFVAHPPFFVVFFGVVVAVSGTAAQTIRLHRPTTPETRQQARILRGALIPGLIVALLWLGAWTTGQLVHSVTMWTDGIDQSLEGWFPAVFVVVPVSLCASIIRYRLWDLELIISRTLLYGALATLAGGAYLAAVVLAGLLTGGGATATVAAMAVVGVMIAPARTRLTALANQIVFGQSLTPSQAVRRLATSLEQLSPAEELLELTHVVVAATRAATSARVWLLAQDQLVPAAQWPREPEGPTSTPLVVGETPTLDDLSEAVAPCEHTSLLLHQGRLLGVLAVTARAELPLSPEEKRLIEDLAGHAGLLVHNAHLAAELCRRIELLSDHANQLRASRQKVVKAQDDERRQLERDIHDSAQQDLVALIVRLHSLRRTAHAAGAPGLDEELEQLRSLVRATTATLNELCGSGLPAALAAGGLAAALTAAAATVGHAGITVTTNIRLPAWIPPDAERAVYFCCAEALQNAAKHARAHRITLELSDVDGLLEFTVPDDGVGFDADTAARSNGLANMNQRLAALGGSLEVRSTEYHGTRLRGRIPLGTPPSGNGDMAQEGERTRT